MRAERSVRSRLLVWLLAPLALMLAAAAALAYRTALGLATDAYDRSLLDPALAIHLVTTNPIESAFSCVRKLTGRVKRWRGGLMKHRWCATGLLDVEKRFRRIKGFSSMPQLIKALDTAVVTEKKIA